MFPPVVVSRRPARLRAAALAEAAPRLALAVLPSKHSIGDVRNRDGYEWSAVAIGHCERI